MNNNQHISHGPEMTFVRYLVIEFIRDHLYEREKDPAWLFDRLANEKVKNGDQNDDLESIREPVLHSLIKVAREIEQFINDKYKDRFTELTEPLIPILKNGSKQKYYDAFKSVADGLFSPEVSWYHIVTFLVYIAELTDNILELPSHKDKDKTFKMVSQIISSICRYFDENLLQWIEEQDEGWMSLLEYERTAWNSNNIKDDSVNGKAVRQYIGVAAIAAIIGGLYLCAKLTVQ